MPARQCHAVPMRSLHRYSPLILPCLLLLLALPPAAQASNWRSGWGLNQRDRAESSDTSAVQLQLRPQAGNTQVWVRHQGHGPLQVRLHAPGRTIDGLPLLRTLPGHGAYLLLTLPDGPAQQLLLDSVPGRPLLTASTGHDYRLPFDPAAGVRVHQAAHGSISHHDPQNRHAWDFALAEGTPVLAARTGQVMAIHASACCSTTRPGDGGNWVRLEHEDGSMAIYAHLQPGSVQVRPGQHVRAGELLAASGNTGYSSAPHLHFAVQINAGMTLHSIAAQLNGPQGRLRASAGIAAP